MTLERGKSVRIIKKIALAAALVMAILVIALGFARPTVEPKPTERAIPAETFTPGG